MYIVPLMEQLNLPDDVSAKANPKSTTGRLGIFTRLICDYGTEFKQVPGRVQRQAIRRSRTAHIYSHSSQRIGLNRLRLVRGNPPSWDGTLAKLHTEESLIYSAGSDGSPTGGESLADNLRLKMD